MKKCPLCGSTKHFNIKKFAFEKLEYLWKKNFGFNPFEKQSFTGNLYKLKCPTCDLIYYEPSFFGEEDFYEKISDNNWYYEENKWEFDEAIEILSQYPLTSLLEVGCGDGAFLEKVIPAFDYTEGVEINKLAIQKCLQKGLNVSSKKLEEIKTQFDAIVSFEVFEHLGEIADFLKNTLDLVADNGILLIAVPNPNGYFKEIDTILLDLPPHHNLGFSKRTFEYIARQFNLTIIEYRQEPLRYAHYQLLLHSVLAYDNSLLEVSLINRIKNKLKSALARFNSPLSFIQDRNLIEGQTHLVVFKKG